MQEDGFTKALQPDRSSNSNSTNDQVPSPQKKSLEKVPSFHNAKQKNVPIKISKTKPILILKSIQSPPNDFQFSDRYIRAS
jgi:hypothetical protein